MPTASQVGLQRRVRLRTGTVLDTSFTHQSRGVVKRILIEPYDTTWAVLFATLRDRLKSALGPLALRIEHVGSTAVPGLHAKPVIDIDVVVPNETRLTEVIDALRPLGYEHQGDLGIEGREAFGPEPTEQARANHHLYVCRESGRELKRHLAFRDYLIAHPERAAEYGRLKQELAQRLGQDREAYTDAKTVFVEAILREAAAQS